MWETIQSNKRKSAVMIVLLATVLMFVGYALGAALDPAAGVLGVLAAMVIWVVLTLTAFAGGEKMLLASAGAREVSREQAPQLYNLVEEMKIASGLPAMPRIFIMDSDVPNAFAVGLKPERAAVAVTTGLMARLNRDELQGVIAHEIGHISNRDTLFMTLAGVMVGAIVILADVFRRSLWYGGGRRRSSSSSKGGQAQAVIAIVAIVVAILAPILARLLYFACSRKREYLADASSAQFTRYPEGLASALDKISQFKPGALKVNQAVSPMFIINPLAATGGGLSLFSTHPPTADRIRVLRGMGKSASLAAYEEAFRAAHKGSGVIASRDLGASVEAAAREGAAGAADPAAQWRSARDLLHQVNRFLVLPCACGLKIKLPPDFKDSSVTCPRCGTKHEVPVAELAAASAALEAAGRK
ncbi:MAG TPA: M48 family metallopeptidase [Kiritimatiellia bacterium]|nr:M48 family metallopeptidase [Kiritimatiellia bacterium]HRZ11035.1 M48 family metallopeptidase [Kiritimatiellia bacterium]HSA18608.1 M48 family metallopeptidase [Kiritimatiellia bacterium]